MATNWTDGECIRLKEMWEAGTRIMEIAANLGRGRNAVIGKAHRLHLVEHPAARPNRKPREPREPRIQVPKPAPDMPFIAPEMTIGGVGFMELEPHQCKAIIGRDDDYYGLARYCGCSVVEDRSWCAYHLAKYTYKVIR